MRRYNFLQTGGFPVDNTVLDGIESIGNLLEASMRMVGNFAIISGVDIAGASASDGVVMINGELLDFKASVVQANVIIKEEPIVAQFEDGSTKQVATYRYATFGSGAVQFPFANFKKIYNLNGLIDKFATVDMSVKSLQTALDTYSNLMLSHIQNANNPHNVTPAQVGILKVGSIYVGDIQGKGNGWSSQSGDCTITQVDRGAANGQVGGDDKYVVSFPNALPTANYAVFIQAQTFDGDWNRSNDIIFTVGNKTVNSFELLAREVSANTQQMNIDFVIIKIS